MVTTTETTEIVTTPKTEEIVQPSFKRWLKHACFMPATKRYFNKQDQMAIAEAVTQAEHGHVGEIQVVIEGHIPANQAYYQDTLGRARQLFAELGVWDTEYNSGVLLYLNLCEQKVEIVIDRGVKQATTQLIWDQICEELVTQLKKQNYRNAVTEAVMQIGNLLDQYYDRKINNDDNELANHPIILG